MKPYYEHAGIMIYHGDCREILPALGTFDLLLTDPPYGINFAGRPTKWQREKGHAAEDWDKSIVENFDEILAHGKTQIVWGGNYYRFAPSRGWLIWFKPDAPPSMASVEMAWTNRDMNSRFKSCSISQTNQERCGHPTQKPLAIIQWSFSFAPEAKTVVDPFLGSGTTLRAAKDLGVKGVGIEIEEKYCEIAAKRLVQEVFSFE